MKSIRIKGKNVPTTQLAAIICACTIAAAAIGGTAENADTAPQVSGAVFYRLKSGDSVILRGLNVYLLNPPDSRAGLLSNVDPMTFAAFQLTLSTLKTEMGVKEALRDCPTVSDVEKRLQKMVNYKETTNIDAKYSLKGIPAGDYRIIAFLDTSGAKGVWDIPVKLGDKSIKLDLDNSNISMVCDVSTP